MQLNTSIRKKTKLISRVTPLLLLAIMVIVSLFPVAVLAAPVLYEYYNTGDDAAAGTYQNPDTDIWLAQTFTTDAETSHTVTSLELKLYRVGTPGTVTAYIYTTDDTDLPDKEQGYLATGTIDGDLCTVDTGGDWYTFTLTSAANLAPETIYAIAIFSETASATDYICWLYDGTAPSYADGSYCQSLNEGDTWTATVGRDFMFEVWGETALEILDVQIFSSVIEDGDWLICVHYNCAVPPAYPGKAASKYFSIVFYGGESADAVAQVKLPAWGYKPAAIYISSDLTEALTWGTGFYYVALEGTSLWGDTPPHAEYYFTPSNWIGADMFQLDAWVRGTAQDMETYYGIDIYTEEVGDTTLPAGEGMLTAIGGDMFSLGIRGLENIRPHLFYYTIHEPDLVTTPPTGVGKPDWEAQVGPDVANMLNTWGDIFNASGQVFGGGLVFIMFVVLIGASVMTGNVPSIVAVVSALPLPLGAWYLGLWPLALAAVLSIIAAMVAFWIFWLRST